LAKRPRATHSRRHFVLASRVKLADEAGAGETIIKKFEDAAEDCCYAFALITPDDFIEKEGKSYFQARPNVLFELGWFYGRYGRDRVCIVKQGKTEMPSDLAGILTIDFQTNVSEGLLNIERELSRVGITGAARGKKRRASGRAQKGRAGNP
jgi:predicted nucleotide-binding protein